MFSQLWKRSVFTGVKNNVRRDKRLKRPRVVPSLECLENRELLSVATPQYIIESSQQTTPAASGANPASPPAGGSSVFTPSQIQEAYGFNQISFASYSGSTLPGAGQTIAIVDAYNDPDIQSNLATFDSMYSLPTANLTVVNQSGGSSLPANNSSWAVEESLDVEWAHAIAPGAKIVLVEASSASMSNLLTAVTTASTKEGASVVSMSWGGNESPSETSYDSAFDTPGVTYVAASGDSGAPPIYPATSPNVLAVGGTTLTLNSSGGYGSETAWSDSGGGISSDEKLPSYQPSTYSNGSSTGTSTKRMSPDVSYDANPDTGFAVYDTDGYGGWLEVGGTSDAAPQWAALIAIANQGRAQDGESALNETGPTQTLTAIYQMPSSNFHDITSGGNGTYNAGPGYDLVTGRGTPIANDVVAYLVNGTSPAPAPSPSPSPPPTPTAPAGLTATAVSSSQIDLSWNSDSGATSYVIDVSTTGSSGSFLQLASTTGTAYNDTTYNGSALSASTTYYYEVFAVNASGQSPPSTASATTLSPPPVSPPPVSPPTPTAPTGLTATAVSSSQIDLSWNTDSGATSYVIDVSTTGSSGSFLQLASTTGTAYNDTTYNGTALSASTTYYYEVFAVNASGQSPPSTAYATTMQSPPPAPPPPAPPPISGLLPDGNFASPSLPSGTYTLDPSGTPWTFYGTAGIASSTSVLASHNPAAPSSQVGFLSGYDHGFSQTVYLSTGNYYTINFDAANSASTARTQEIAVAVDDTILAMGTPASTQYNSYSTGSFYVTASGYYTVTFVGINSSSGIALIDNVGLGAMPFTQQGRSNSSGYAMVSLSGSSSPSVSTLSNTGGPVSVIGSPAPVVNSPAPVVNSPAPVVNSPTPVVNSQVPQPNANLGVLTNLASTTSLPLIDQLFLQLEQELIAEWNSLLAMSDFGSLLASWQAHG